MSIWTHVAAVVRIDDFQTPNGTNYKDYFGKEIHFGDGVEAWNDYHKHPEDYLPCGSEGSLSSSIWVNPHTNHLDAYTVTIFGDLRDYSATEEILEWFKEKLKCIPMIRQAVITIEGIDVVTWNYVTDRDWFFELEEDEGCDD